MLFHGSDIFIIALLALLLDRQFGEFSWIRHPVILMGDLIKGFEKYLYQNSILRGALLTLLLTTLCAVIGVLISFASSLLPPLLSIILLSILASMLIAHRMLHDAVLSLIQTDQPQVALRGLVSRDTENLSDSDCYKAGIESYAENLSDGLIAPLFYLLLFGLPGILVYKAINTLDSMVGYRIDRYEKFGKVSARVDDVVNWIPARITAALIMLINRRWQFWAFYAQGKHHDSPNAGHPITAMALNINCQLGGDTVYFGELKHKACFGKPNASKIIQPQAIEHCLQNRTRVDTTLYVLLVLAIVLTYFGNFYV
ncbi:MAG: adenosylcobinamide-phosphate synthase [Thiomicrorhabdus sp.]|nr:MAG: adenosylcobinamide-phosphate synthase [Thiomicrorhabdus sp.]